MQAHDLLVQQMRAGGPWEGCEEPRDLRDELDSLNRLEYIGTPAERAVAVLLGRDIVSICEAGRVLVSYADPDWVMQPLEGGRAALYEEYDVLDGWEESAGWRDFQAWFDGGPSPGRNGTRQAQRGGGEPIIVTNNSRAGDRARNESSAARVVVESRHRRRGKG